MPPKRKSESESLLRFFGRSSSNSASTQCQHAMSDAAMSIAPAVRVATHNAARLAITQPVDCAVGCTAENKSGCIAAGVPWMQYNNIYRMRLRQMRERVLAESRARWPDTELATSGGTQRTDTRLVLLGIIFKEMPKRHNIMHFYREYCSFQTLEDASQVISSDSL